MNPRVRSAPVECAWRMVRFQPQYPPVARRLAVLAKGSRAIGAVRKKAIVAVARQLAVDLWRIQYPRRRRPEQLGLHTFNTDETPTQGKEFEGNRYLAKESYMNALERRRESGTPT